MAKQLTQITFDFIPGEEAEDTSATDSTVIVEEKEMIQVKEEPIVITKEEPVAPAPGKRGRRSLKDIGINADLINIPPDDILFQKQYYSIGEVAAMFRENQSLIRYWETEFDILQPRKNRKGENTELKKHADAMEARQLVIIRNELLQKDEIINGVNFIGDIIEVSNADALKKLCLDLKNHLRDHVAVLCVNLGGKPFVAIGISETVVAAKNLDAGKIIKEIVAPLIKGGGGGQKTLATAGGQEPGRLQEVIEAVKSLL